MKSRIITCSASSAMTHTDQEELTHLMQEKTLIENHKTAFPVSVGSTTGTLTVISEYRTSIWILYLNLKLRISLSM